ncbi:winged helix-turn-helix domain-containing protein [uncultured Methanomethylovorans sp.]|uniref:winged helix-turn-helix domain-containing protein n=1 Tax=uncultured Methanomethylovorans sp. TaxID=183759 RepID=UPI002AA7A6C6|nr:winged helix-turn-helix domain-containing protein [uncultured Methanomethylovorans sp.]
MKRRERLEIIYDILSLISKNENLIRPTPLLRKSNLSSSQFDYYITELIEKGFVEIHTIDCKQHYRLKKKGFEYLKQYKVILKIIDDFEL